jgi:tetratricopeptide (TPR) repeat protein
MSAPLGPATAPFRRAAILGITTLLASGALAEPPESLVARGNDAWARRAEGSRDGRAAISPIGQALSAYEAALESSPDTIAIRERLLRALYFQGQFATDPGPTRRAIFQRGRDLAEEGVARLAAEIGLDSPFDLRPPDRVAAALADHPESVALYFWAAAHWGLWGETSGAFAAARQGVAHKVRDYAEIVTRIDERYETGGGHRILGRLYTEAPRIPLITGWVDRELALASLERAMALAPGEPLNRLYMADALLRFRPKREDEAIALLEALATGQPRADSILEDEHTLSEARRLLDEARD